MSDSSHRRAANLLGALALAVGERLGQATRRGDGFSENEPATLVTLLQYPDQSIEALRRTLRLTHSGAVRLVDRLEAVQLLRRIPSGHGRTLAVRLTPAGRRAARSVLARRQRALEAVLSALREDEIHALEAAAERLLAGLTTDRQSAYRTCRLCDESACVGTANCPVDRAVET